LRPLLRGRGIPLIPLIVSALYILNIYLANTL
jgi:hypothetical protein